MPTSSRHRMAAVGALVAALVVTGTLPGQAAPTEEPGPAPGSYRAGRAAVPAAQVAAAEAAAERDELAGTRPVLRVPFRCGQRWSGESRSGHSPSYWALDFNWVGGDDLGKPVKASAAGLVVRSAFDAGGYGNYVEVARGNGWHTLYAHLSAKAVQVNDRVTDSQRVGRVGSTGNSSGPHLHYEQIKDNVVVRARFGQSTWAEYPGPRIYVRERDC